MEDRVVPSVNELLSQPGNEMLQNPYRFKPPRQVLAHACLLSVYKQIMVNDLITIFLDEYDQVGIEPEL